MFFRFQRKFSTISSEFFHDSKSPSIFLLASQFPVQLMLAFAHGAPPRVLPASELLSWRAQFRFLSAFGVLSSPILGTGFDPLFLQLLSLDRFVVGPLFQGVLRFSVQERNSTT